RVRGLRKAARQPGRAGHRLLRHGRRRRRGGGGAGHHHGDVPCPQVRVGRRREPAQVLRGTGVTSSLAAAHVASTLPAVGVQRAAWLLLAFPLAGAAILLLGGKRTNRWGHVVGVVMPLAAFGYAVVAFIAMLGYPANQRSRVLTLFTWIHV